MRKQVSDMGIMLYKTVSDLYREVSDVYRNVSDKYRKTHRAGNSGAVVLRWVGTLFVFVNFKGCRCTQVRFRCTLKTIKMYILGSCVILGFTIVCALHCVMEISC